MMQSDTAKSILTRLEKLSKRRLLFFAFGINGLLLAAIVGPLVYFL